LLAVRGDLERAVEADAFRIAQEALHNALRHAAAEHIDVRLRCEDERLELTVTDDGAGFDPDEVRSTRLGLTTMAERARAAGGTLAIESSPGAGTAVRLEVPA